MIPLLDLGPARIACAKRCGRGLGPISRSGRAALRAWTLAMNHPH